jgi:hypothetical protein
MKKLAVLTNEVQMYVTDMLLADFIRARNRKTRLSTSLSYLYANVRARFENMPAGIFVKVIDDMSKIGLITVDRRTKCVVDVDTEGLFTDEKLDEFIAKTSAANAAAKTLAGSTEGAV